MDDHQFDRDLCVVTAGGVIRMTISLTVIFVWSLQVTWYG